MLCIVLLKKSGNFATTQKTFWDFIVINSNQNLYRDTHTILDCEA